MILKSGHRFSEKIMPHPYARAGPSRIIGSPSLGSIQRAHRTLLFPPIATSGARPDMASIDKFNEHCWKDVIPQADLELYAGWRRETFVGPRPALLAIDLYDLVYRGGPHPPNELNARYPNSCGIFAHRAIAPTKRLLAAARAAGIPIFYCTQETRPQNRPQGAAAPPHE